MPQIETWELERARSDIADLLPDDCNLLTRTYASDGFGGFTETWGTATASVACRLDVIKPREQVISDRNTHYSQYMISLPYGTTINSNYRIEIGSAQYNVVGIAPEKSWEAVKRVTVERV